MMVAGLKMSGISGGFEIYVILKNLASVDLLKCLAHSLDTSKVKIYILNFLTLEKM